MRIDTGLLNNGVASRPLVAEQTTGVAPDPKRLNVLVVGENPHRMSGLGGCMRQVFLYRISTKHNVDIAAWFDFEKKCTYQIEKYDYHQPGAWHRRQEQIEKILQKKKYDVVITVGDPWYFEDIPDLKYRYGFKWVFWVTVDGDPMGRYFADVCSHADELVSMSHHGVGVIKHEFAPARVSVVYPGYDAKTYKPLPVEERERIRTQPAGKIRDRVVFLWAGQNTNRKQLPLFLNYCAALRDSLPEDRRDKVMFVVMSGLDDIAAVNNAGLIAARNRFGEELHWINMTPDRPIPDSLIVEWLSCADYYVSTAVGEGFNMFMQQARACGCPVIVPLHTAMAEQASPNGIATELYADETRQPPISVAMCECGFGITNNTKMPGEFDFNRYVVNGEGLLRAMTLGVSDILDNGRHNWNRFRQNCIESTRPYTWDTIANAFMSLIGECDRRDRKFMRFEVF